MYTHLEAGNSPVILCIPHDGSKRVVGAATRKEGKRDLGTLALAMECRRQLRQLGIDPSLQWFGLHRSHVDVNRPPDGNAFAEGFSTAYEEFHLVMAAELQRVVTSQAGCLFIDFHGYVNSPGPDEYDIVIGSDEHRTARHDADQRLAAHLSRHYRTVFSPDPSRNVTGIYRGGWIVRSVAAGWGHEGVDAVQLEFNRHLRQPEVTAVLAMRLAFAIKQTLDGA